MIPKEKSYDYQYYMSLPEGSRVELIDGQIYDMAAAPSLVHQEVTGSLYYLFKNYLKGKSCRVFISPIDVYLIDDVQNIKKCKNIVQPDIAVICDNSKLHLKGCIGAPDLIIEVVSPSSRMMDYVKKLSLYCEHGVKEYWIIDPMRKNIYVYVISDDGPELNMFNFQDKINVGIFGDLVIDFSGFELDFINN